MICRPNNLVTRLFLGALWLTLAWITSSAAAKLEDQRPAAQNVRLRFVDSATGYAIKPDAVEVTPLTEPGNGQRVRRNGVKKDGRTVLSLAEGGHRIKVNAPGYHPMDAEFVLQTENQFNLVFQLDPIAQPREIQPDYVATLHQHNQTVFVGFVVDEDTGQAITNAAVRTEPSGGETRTDSRGFFQIYVPVQTLADATNTPAKLSWSAPGFRTEERCYLELWSEGDWIYRIRLERGEGIHSVDERPLRRRTDYPIATIAADSTDSSPEVLAAPKAASPPTPVQDAMVQPIFSGAEGVSPKLTQVVPVRIPTNIRVLRQDGVTIDYISLQTYCQRSLASEVYASWANYSGGSNSLQAVAVAIRTYAIGFINNPYNANYDICGTTACQAYNNTANSSQTTAAVNNTVNYVMIQPGATRIGFKLTEYSAENNQLGLACGDGFTAPNSGCLADPVCTGESENGHGKGMCQWGTVKWATGLKFPGNNFSNTTLTNGQPKQDWMWICQHYYPALQLVQGLPLSLNDYVQVQGTASLAVRQCADGSISTGTSCPVVATKSTGANGLIIGGPVRVTSDGVGYTWWQVQWFDANATIGWAPENWLERIAMPLNVPPVLNPIADLTITEGSLINFTNTATASANAETLVTDFETFASGTAGGTVMFRSPNFSGSTSAFLDAAPNISSITGTFPPGNDSGRVLQASWSWNATANPWLRLTTASATSLPNPVIDLTRKLSFDIYSDKNIGIALGVRETGNPTGTAIGVNGGNTPAIIEFVGVTNAVSGQPQVTRSIQASNWMTVTFNLPAEAICNFAGGNGVLSSATGLGVLEHLAFVPGAGSGTYNVYLDNFIVSTPRVLTYSLSNAPAGATINPSTGWFTWTPSETQGPGLYSITVRVTDNNLPPASDAKTFHVTVLESNQPPVLAPISDRLVHAGTLVTFTNVATDADQPTNTLSYFLAPGAASGAAIGLSDGVFHWQTEDADAGTTNHFSVSVADNGTPALSNTNSFTVAVLARPTITEASVTNGGFNLSWTAIPGQKYRVQFKDDLTAPNWTDLGPDLNATLETVSRQDSLSQTQRFYRVLVVTP